MIGELELEEAPNCLWDDVGAPRVSVARCVGQNGGHVIGDAPLEKTIRALSLLGWGIDSKRMP